jgi:phage antirepressor YoqD-like protein
MNDLIDLKNNPNQLEGYFRKIKEWSDSGKLFPADLTYVWPLVYADKGKAVRALINDSSFIENVDYKVVTQNGKNLKGGRPEETYWLSTPCLEYFIARKVRDVFEVYRTIFHIATQPKPFVIPQTLSQALQLAADQAKVIEEQQTKIQEDAPKLLMAEQVMETGDNITVSQFANLVGMGSHTYFRWLKDNGHLFNRGFRKNVPYQKWLDEGIFTVKDVIIQKGDVKDLHVQTFITPIGQIHLTNKLKNNHG